MAEVKTEQPETKVDDELTDEEIAELANRKLKEKDAEIKTLRTELNKLKLLSTAEEEEEEPLSREECIKRISDSNICNYDYAEAVIGLVDAETNDGRPNPLGPNGEAVYDFFKSVIEACDGDKSKFTTLYQTMIGADEPLTAAKRNKRN